MSRVRDDAATTTCPLCGGPFVREGRHSYCSTLCCQRAWRRRREAPAGACPSQATTVYEYDSCGARALGEQYCEECRTFMRRIEPGSPRPHCDELVALQDIISESQIGPPTRWRPHDYLDL